jgi:capsular exopolysaccharide synthesis family protein
MKTAGDTRGVEPDAPATPRQVSFLETGSVAPAKISPLIDSLKDAHSVAGEELRLLRAKVRKAAEGGRRCIGITSALPGEGKSTLSAGLAAALARDAGRRVLLVEADLRRPTIAKTLGLAPASGLGEFLRGGLDDVPVRLVQPGGFHLVVAGRMSLEEPELLGSPLMDGLLRSARTSFDVVLLDVAPILPVADTILMQDLVDGFLLVVRSRQTPRDAILEALGRLREDKIMGFVLNDHREYARSYTSYAYERYGMAAEARRGGGRPR